MQVRKAKETDERDLKALWAYCFEKPGDPFFDWYFRRLYEPGKVLVGETGGQIACALHRRPYEVYVRGEDFSTDYIVGVATHPAARGRGHAAELLRGEFHIAAGEDKPFVLLMPSAASYYLPLGFSFAVHQWERKASPETLGLLGKKPEQARTVNDPLDWQDLAAVYDAYTKDRNLYAFRDGSSWEQHLEGQLQEGYIAVVYDEKGPSGYLFYSIEDRCLTVSEMAFARESGRKGLYAYMAGHRGSVSQCVWYEPLDDDSYRTWNDGAEHTYIQNRTFPYMMVRLTDPVAAFDGLPCDEDLKGEIAFQLADSFLPENSGMYVLRAEEGKIHALKEDVFYSLKCHIEDISGVSMGSVSEPAFCLNAGALAELFTGASDLEGLLRNSRAVWLISDERKRKEILRLAACILPKQANWINEWY